VTQAEYVSSSPSESAGALTDLLALLTLDVTAVSKKVESSAEAPMAVYVVDQNEINRWGVRNLYETMQRVPGFNFYNIDYYGQYGIGTRGLYSIWRVGYSMELMKIPDFGHVVFAPRFYKNIEAARGPSGLTWGSAAEAGLININIRDDLEGAEVAGEMGNSGRWEGDFMYGGKFGDRRANDGFFAGFHYEQQDFQTQNNAFDIPGEQWRVNGLLPSYDLLAKIQYHRFKVIFDRQHANHVAPHLWFGGDTTAEDKLSNAIQGQIGQVTHDEFDLIAIRGEYQLVKWKNSSPDANFNSLDILAFGNYFDKNWFMMGVASDNQIKQEGGLGVQGLFLAKRLDVNLGSEVGRDATADHSMTTTWAHDNFGINWYDTQLMPDVIPYVNAYGQVKGTILRGPQNKLLTIFGTRWDWEQHGVPSPSVIGALRGGLIYSPLPALTGKLLYNQTNRRPSFNERYGLTADTSPGNEILRSGELIAVYNDGKLLQGDISLSYQTLTDSITRVNSNDALNRYVNGGGMGNWAIEWSTKVRPIKPLLIYANGSLNKATATNKSAIVDGISQDVSLAHNSSNQLIFVPEFTGIVGGEYVFNEIGSVHADVRVIGPIPYFGSDNSERKSDTAAFVDMTASTRFFKIHREEYKIKFSAVALNILDGQPRLPAFGEHAENRNGTLSPEGRRAILRVTVALP
jgi:outer membrane receptor protein involved in Fe transport